MKKMGIVMTIVIASIMLMCTITPTIDASDKEINDNTVALIDFYSENISIDELPKNGITTTEQIDSICESTVLVSNEWYNSNGPRNASKIVTKLLNNDNIVVARGNPTTFTNEYSEQPLVAFAEDADIYAMYHDGNNNRTVCCSISAGSIEKSIEKLNLWSHDVRASKPDFRNNTAKAISSNANAWGTELLCNSYKYFDDYGWLNITTCYFPLVEDNARYNYYYTRYDMQSVPDSNRYTADLNVKATLGDTCTILDYAPTTTEGQTTIGVDLSLNSDGVIGAGLSWSYSSNDVKVRDESNVATNLFYIKHDINEYAAVGSNTYKAQPGKIVRVDCQSFAMTGSYASVDEYEIVFGKKVQTGIIIKKETMQLSSFSLNVGVLCRYNPHTVTVDTNGADDHELLYEEPYLLDPSEPYSITVSDGGRVDIDRDYYLKTGYTFVGFSTNKNASVAEYGTSLRIIPSSDLYLYMIWVKE